MKKFYLLYFIILLLAIIGFTTIQRFVAHPVYQELDMGQINHIVYSAANAPSLKNLEDEDFAYDFSVFMGGEVQYKTDPLLPDTLHDSIRQGMITMDKPGDPGGWDKIMISTGLSGRYASSLDFLKKRMMVLLVCIVFLLLLYFVMIHRMILSPFKKMSDFAGRIAEGQLDAPLDMDRHNIFGSFTESFDLMRENLKESRYREMDANRSKKEMIASLSHDIKTPVTVIRLHIEYLQMQLYEEKHLEKLNAMRDKIDQINYLADNLLQNAMEELGHLKVYPIHEDSKVLEVILQSVHVREDMHIQQVPDCLICIDRKRMEQIISNILYNAEKYAGTQVDVKFAIIDSFLQMDISDYGKGVEETEIAYLCEKFFRGQSAMESGKEGEGLGLYISAFLMEQMSGELICINKPDGFTVRLLMPLSY